MDGQINRKEKQRIDIKKYVTNIKSDLVVDKLNAVEWIVLGLLLMMIWLTLFYGDNLGIFITYFWTNEGLFNGGNIRFLGNNQLTYGIVQQILGELWVLPANLIYRFYKFNAANTVTVLWYKLCMPVIMTLVMHTMIRIGKELFISAKRIKWMLILMLSTVLVALPVFHIAQTDLLYSLLILLGIEAFIKDNRKRFILFFAMAISCKVIAVFVFVPLVLMREKRIFYLLRDIIFGCMIVPIERVWYKIVGALNNLIVGKQEYVVQVQQTVNDKQVVVEKSLDQVNTDFMSHFYHKMLFFEFPAVRKGYMASLLVTLFVLLCIWCYVQKKDDIAEWNYKCIYVSVVAWLIFFVNSSPSPYWIVAMYPMLFLMVFMKTERIRLNMLLVNVYTLSMFLVYIMNTGWVYGGSMNLDYLLLKGLLKPGHVSDYDEGPCVVRYLNNLGVDSIMNIVTAVCLASAIAIVVANYHKIDIKEDLSDEYEHKLMHGMTIFQIGFLGIWYIINVWVVSRW